jgi:hypothetical protein
MYDRKNDTFAILEPFDLKEGQNYNPEQFFERREFKILRMHVWQKKDIFALKSADLVVKNDTPEISKWLLKTKLPLP